MVLKFIYYFHLYFCNYFKRGEKRKNAYIIFEIAALTFASSSFFVIPRYLIYSAEERKGLKTSGEEGQTFSFC